MPLPRAGAAAPGSRPRLRSNPPTHLTGKEYATLALLLVLFLLLLLIGGGAYFLTSHLLLVLLVVLLVVAVAGYGGRSRWR